MTFDLSFLTQPAAGLVGVAAIAYQTKRGFANLIKSQEHKGALDRDARLHIHELNRIQRLEENAFKAKKISAALIGELDGLYPRPYSLSQSLEADANRTKRDKESKIGFRTQTLEIGKTETPIFDSVINDLGYLHPSIVRDVCFIYAKNSFPFRFAEMQTHEIHIETCENISRYYRDLALEAAALSARLSAVSDGDDDPGPVMIKYDIDSYFGSKGRNEE
jgi:hypothetical protein